MNKDFTILLAEDEDGFALPYEKYLKKNDFKVIRALDVQELSQTISNADFLVVDVRLPEIFEEGNAPGSVNGIKIISKHIKNQNISKSMPIIFISVLDEKEPACQEALKELNEVGGSFKWLQKPFEPEYLCLLIEKHLKK